jgi:hypothetical protein
MYSTDEMQDMGARQQNATSEFAEAVVVETKITEEPKSANNLFE